MNTVFPKLLAPLMVVFLFLTIQACNQSGNVQEQSHTEVHDQAHDTHDEHVDHDHEMAETHILNLNSGAKWQADEPTNHNAQMLMAIGKQFSDKAQPTLKDYQTFGGDVNAGINKMIRECTMEGAADQALHVWFAPLLGQASTLSRATDVDGLAEIAAEMIHRLEIYPDYFE